MNLETAGVGSDHNRAAPLPGGKFDLPALIDLALTRNPDTRAA